MKANKLIPFLSLFLITGCSSNENRKEEEPAPQKGSVVETQKIEHLETIDLEATQAFVQHGTGVLYLSDREIQDDFDDIIEENQNLSILQEVMEKNDLVAKVFVVNDRNEKDTELVQAFTTMNETNKSIVDNEDGEIDAPYILFIQDGKIVQAVDDDMLEHDTTNTKALMMTSAEQIKNAQNDSPKDSCDSSGCQLGE